MKKMLAFTLSLVMLFTLTACQGEKEPPAPADSTASVSQFADANQDQDRYYKSIRINGTVYGNNYYYIATNITIKSVPLPKREETSERSQSSVVCSDTLCTHRELDCPAYIRDPISPFLLDATESNGEQPVFYYSHCTAGNIAFSDAWESGQRYEIVRYDSGQGKAEAIASVNYPIIQFMTYGEHVYIIAQTGVEQNKVFRASKKGGEVIELSTGGTYLNLIGANKNSAYVNDEKGNVYAVVHDQHSAELIYTVSEFYSMESNVSSDFGMFVEDEYLYFYSDFEVKEYPENPTDPDSNDYTFLKHSIRRVRLDELNGEGEMVADSVFERAVFGVYNGVLYYGPFNVRTGFFYAEKQMQASNYTASEGTVIGVKLDTLESFEVVKDCGYNFVVDPFYINDRCIVTYAYPYRNGMGVSVDNAGGFPALFDFETGALYNVYNGVRLYDGTADE